MRNKKQNEQHISTNTSRVPNDLRTTFNQLRACQLSSWYPTFRNLHKLGDVDNKGEGKRIYPYNNVTIRSIIIKPLPQSFIEYLQSDGIILPKGAEKVSSFLPDIDDGGGYNNNEWSSDEEEGEEDEQDVAERNDERKDDHDHPKKSKKKNKKAHYYFPELNEQITNALEQLGPSIPKLNWSSPKDVTWINGESMKCCTVGDVYLLLQSSDFCMFDIAHALDEVEIDDDNYDKTLEYELVLRKWSNLHPSMEFRCFVSNHELGKRDEFGIHSLYGFLLLCIGLFTHFFFSITLSSKQSQFHNGITPNSSLT